MSVRSMVLGVGLVLGGGAPLFAQEPAKDGEEPYVYEEQVVVSASRTEEALVNAPAAIPALNPGISPLLPGPMAPNCGVSIYRRNRFTTASP